MLIYGLSKEAKNYNSFSFNYYGNLPNIFHTDPTLSRNPANTVFMHELITIPFEKRNNNSTLLRERMSNLDSLLNFLCCFYTMTLTPKGIIIYEHQYF